MRLGGCFLAALLWSSLCAPVLGAGGTIYDVPGYSNVCNQCYYSTYTARGPGTEAWCASTCNTIADSGGDCNAFFVHNTNCYTLKDWISGSTGNTRTWWENAGGTTYERIPPGCPPGFTGTTDNCALCTAGTFKVFFGEGACSACPANSVSPDSTPYTHCLCDTGYTGPDIIDATMTCTACPAGQYKDTVGSATCLPQGWTLLGDGIFYDGVGNSYGLITVSECAVECDNLLHLYGGYTEYSRCYGFVMFDDGWSGGPNCYLMNRESWAHGEPDGTNTGLIFDSRMTGLYERTIDPGCMAGTTGSTGSCTNCVAGTYKTTVGSAACTACPTDTTSPAGSGHDNQCVCDVGYDMKDIVDNGIFSAAQCEVCEANTYKAVTDNSPCITCPYYYGPHCCHISSIGSTALTDCQCMAGLTGPDGEYCNFCPEGTYKSTVGSAACSACPANSNSILDAGYWATDCLCNAGYSGPDSGTCTACATGSYKSSPGSAACSACPADSPSNAALTECLCNAGYSGPAGGPCTACSAGTYTYEGLGVCVDCPAGTYSYLPAATTCDECTAALRDSTSPAGSDAASDCLCGAGYTASPGGSNAVCYANRYPDLLRAFGYDATALYNHYHENNHGLSEGRIWGCTCDTCPADSTSPAGSDAASDCLCGAGYTAHNGVLSPATGEYALLALNTGQPAAELPSSVVADGPVARSLVQGYLSFDRAQSHFLDRGPMTLDMASNGGLTIMAVVRFTGDPGTWERIVDFGNGESNDNIILGRNSNANALTLNIRNGATSVCSALAGNLPQDKWITVLARYHAASLTTDLWIDDVQVATGTCTAPVTDRTVTGTYIGKSHWAWIPCASVGGIYTGNQAICCLASCGTCGGSGCDSRPGGGGNCCQGAITSTECTVSLKAPCRNKNIDNSYFNGDIAALVVVDAYQTMAELLTPECVACPAGTTAPPGSTARSQCACGAGSSSAEYPLLVPAETVVYVNVGVEVPAITGYVWGVFVKNGDYVQDPSTSTGLNNGGVDFTVECPDVTTIQFQMYHISTHGNADSVYIRIDSAGQTTWDTGSDTSIRWSNPSLSFGVGSGIHTVSFQQRGYGIKIYTFKIITGSCYFVRQQLPTHVAAGGPVDRSSVQGYLSFDRALSQFLDRGPMTFNMASNGGLTIMAVVRFTGDPGTWEKIVDFGNGAGNDNIYLSRGGASNTLMLSIRNGGTTVCTVAGGVVPQNTWLTIHAMYQHETQSVELWVNGVRVAADTCKVNTDIDYARACGAQQNTACLAAQTTTYSNNYAADGASVALDNSLSTSTHTACCGYTNPCWRVDLGKTVLIQALTLTGRQDCCYIRSASFAVYVGDSDDMEDMTKHEVCVFNQPALPQTGSRYVECERPLYGRYVYVYLPTSEYLSLGDVKVWGTRSATDRTVTGTYIGKSHWSIDAYFSGDIAALEVVDAYRGIGANLAPGCAACAAGEYGLALQAAGGTQVIVGYQDVPRNWDEVHAFVVAKGGSLLTAQEMIAWLAEHGAVAIENQWAPVYNPDIASPHKDWVQVGVYANVHETGKVWSVNNNPDSLSISIDDKRTADNGQQTWNRYYIWKLDASPGVCTMEAVTGDRGWRRVRHLPATSTVLHPATDNLAGTDTYGDPDDDSIAWSIPFGAFDQFLFATGDGRHWLVATREAVIGENYDNTPRDVIKSSRTSTTYTANWYFRLETACDTCSEDPRIGTHSWSSEYKVVLYCEASKPYSGHGQQHGGLDVFVRDAGPNMEAVTGEKGWRRVRHLPATSTAFHPATDDLAGTDTYGDPDDDSTAWSVPFGAFDEFLFATGDGRHWLIATPEAVNGENYENAPRDINKSSYNSIPYTAQWYFRSTVPSDPAIATKSYDLSDKIVLYREDTYVHAVQLQDMQAHGGLNVFVRLRDAGPTTSACAREYPACAACAAGTYSGSEGSTECAACPANSHSSAALTDCLCNAGYSGPDGGPYTACVAGSYKTSPGPGACTLCGEDTYSVSVAATASSVCLACPPDSTTLGLIGNDNIERCYCDLGYKQSLNHTTCDICKPGFYDDATKRYVCSKCPAGTHSDQPGGQGVEACDDCPAGTWSTPDTPVCNICPGHSNSPVKSGLLTDCTCNAGAYGADGTTCQLCPAGKYKANTGSDACQDCLAGTYSIAIGADSPATCVACPANANAPAGSDEQTDCLCDAGYSGPDGGSCAECSAGTFKDTAGSAACSACPAGSASPAGSDEHTDCTCNAGSTGPDGGTCTQCVAGKYKLATGAAACTNCLQGHYSTVNGATADVCQACPADSTSPAGSDALTDCQCNAGYLDPGGGPCEACVEGTFHMAGGVCTDRLTDTGDTWEDGGGFTCAYYETDPTYCGHDASSWEVRDSSLTMCCVCEGKMGSWFDHDQMEVYGYSEDMYVVYENTVWAQAQIQSCAPCPADSTSPAGSTADTDCQCNAGYSGVDGGTCTPCAADNYKDSLGSAACAACPENSHSPTGSDALTDCLCNAGYTGPDGGPCTACAADTYKDTTGQAACSACPGNTTSPAGSVSEEACVCVAGYTLLAASDCSPCAAGTYKNDAGDGACTACPANASSLPGSASAAACECFPGFHGHAHSSPSWRTASGAPRPGACTMCPAGKYKAGFGEASADHVCEDRPDDQGNPWQDGDEWTCSGSSGGSSYADTANTPFCGFADSVQHCCVCRGALSAYYAEEPVVPEGTFGQIAYDSSVWAGSACTACPHGSSSPPGSPSFAECRCNGTAGYRNRLDAAHECACLPGFYELRADGHLHCLQCPADHWCPGSTLNGTSTGNRGQKVSCPGHSTSPPALHCRYTASVILGTRQTPAAVSLIARRALPTHTNPRPRRSCARLVLEPRLPTDSRPPSINPPAHATQVTIHTPCLTIDLCVWCVLQTRLLLQAARRKQTVCVAQASTSWCTTSLAKSCVESVPWTRTV